MLFENEKERAKTNMEKDQLVQNKLDLQEQVERLKKKAEDLLRENEKLKIDRAHGVRK
jgi:regulator of replication initiation timing